MFLSTKLFEGYSCCFRQWRATHSHCSQLHGYAISAKIWFACSELDDKNWSEDFGAFKRNGINKWLSDMFDHTLIVAQDDPQLELFATLADSGAAKLVVVENVGCERFAEMIFHKVQEIVQSEHNGRVWVQKVEVFEHHKNSAIYEV